MENSIITLLYDPSIEEMQYIEIILNISTLIHDRLFIACNKTNLSVDSFLNVAIIRALFDYEQYSNKV
jgi:hypothetical protein